VSRAWAVGLDMGGTNIRTAAVSTRGEVIMMNRAPSLATRDGPTVAENIAAQIRELIADAARRGIGAPRAICAAVPGPLNPFTGTVMAAPHVAAWRGFALRDHLEAALGARVEIENDANAWALGEFWRGAARGRRDVVLLTLGTGVGGGVIAAGALLRGRSGMAAELGHVTVEPDGIECDCGARGCLESYASASGLRRMIERRTAPRSIPGAMLDASGEFSVRALTTLARRGDKVARTALATAGRYLGIAIAGFLNSFNPELVVIGGGVAGAMPWMRAAMMAEVRARAFSVVRADAAIVRAALGPRGGVVGAAWAALHPVARS
jgi:glucokinase